MVENSTGSKRTMNHITESGPDSKRTRPTPSPTHFHTDNSTHSGGRHNLTSSATRNLPQVVIDSTTYDVGYGSETITRAIGSPVVLEPSGIVVGSSSVPFPSSVEPTASSTDQMSKSLTVDGVSVTVETPSPTHFGRLAPVTDVIINGETFMIPQSKVELPREDGSTLVLAPSAVIIGTQTFYVPLVSKSTFLTASGSVKSSESNTVIVQPGPTKKPSTGGLLGFTGLLHALGNVASDAGEASSSISKVMDEGAKWAAGSMKNGDSGFASAIDDALNTGTARLLSTQSSFAGLGKDLSTELEELSPSGKRAIQAVDKSCSSTFDWLRTVGDLARRLPKLVGKNRRIVDNALRLIFTSAKNHPLVTGNMALAAFEVYQWSKEPKSGMVPPAQSNTATADTNTTQPATASTNTTEPATTTSSSSTSTTTDSDPTRIPYTIGAKWNAPPGRFQEFVKTLPEPGSHVGEDGHLNHGQPFWNLYFTKLSRKEAAEVRQNDFIACAVSAYETPFEYHLYGAATNIEGSHSHKLLRRDDPTGDQYLYIRPDSADHLRLVSQPRKDNPANQNPYLFDPSLGDTSSVYILDTGCDRQHRVRTVLAQLRNHRLTLIGSPSRESCWSEFSPWLARK